LGYYTAKSTKIKHTYITESPARGLRLSPPACTASVLSKVQKPHDLEIDLGSGEGHINLHSMCRTTSMSNHVTVASRTTEI